jgi:hypothetical protein
MDLKFLKRPLSIVSLALIIIGLAIYLAWSFGYGVFNVFARYYIGMYAILAVLWGFGALSLLLSWVEYKGKQ